MNTLPPLAQTYCNPLPIPAIPVGRNAYDAEYTGPWWREFGDPTVIRFRNRWYLFPSCGMLWHSDDMRVWQQQRINLYDVGWAPSVVEHAGALYLTASWEGSELWRATDPLGHWECLGPIRDELSQPFSWGDPMLFADDDGRLYAYFCLGANRGIFGVPLRADDPTRFAAAPVCLFAFNPEHEWERFGECQQDPTLSHLEGAFMSKQAGRYYLQYSAAGAQWRNYAVGCYIGEGPLGPFRYQRRNPILRQRGGLVNGCGHHCLVVGPDGGLWCFYTVLMRRFRGLERRLAMDPARFDADGELYIDGPSESPRYLDGGYPQGLLPLSVCQPAVASSCAPGHPAEYAVDNYIRTWWQADSPACPQDLTVDLGQTCVTGAARIVFQEQVWRGGGGPAVFRYRVEGSCDQQQWTLLCDRQDSDFDGHIRYDTWPGQPARWLRLTLTQVPVGTAPGLIDLCVFGRVQL